MKDPTRKPWIALCNKYVVAIIIFAIIICFVDENNLMVSSHLLFNVHKLHKEEAELYKDFQADSLEAQSLRDDRQAMERFGRENYYMKAADEDIFIINSTDRKRPKD